MDSLFLQFCLWNIPIRSTCTRFSQVLSYFRCTSPRSGALADILWFNAHIGIGLYIYRQRFMQKTNIFKHITFTVFCTVIFNFGSALIWGTIRSLLPAKADRLKIGFGLVSGLTFLWIGNSLVQHVNALCPWYMHVFVLNLLCHGGKSWNLSIWSC